MGIQLGLVGLGAFGSAFACLFKAHPLVDRILVCDREPERARRYADDPAFQDKLKPTDVHTEYAAVLASDVDAVVLITQPWLHAAQAVEALEAGKHVYSAVPVIMLPDSDEILEWCDRLVNTCRETGRRYMLGETTCYRPETMFCRRRAGNGGFGEFLHADGHYLHDVDVPGSNLREVRARRYASRAGQEWKQRERTYQERGVIGGPMHYPTHSVSGPLSVMRTHGLRVTAKGFAGPTDDPFFDHEMSNETAFFYLANGATMRISEFRLIGHPGEETFRLFGTRGTYREDQWATVDGIRPLSPEEMRDPLPPEVMDAFSAQIGEKGVYGGHGGSHPHLVHEFVSSIAEDRQPAINAWEAVRYMACGATAHKSALADGEMLSIPDWGDAPVR